MNCEVFQEKINDFIFDRIEYSEDLEDFLSHAKECKDCMEELQLYYTIHRGLEDVPAPFEGEETKKAEEELQDLQRQKSYKKAARISIIAILAIVLSIISYVIVKIILF